MARKSNREQILREAWIGDAVLCLYARRKILKDHGTTDDRKAQRLTSNQFLSAFAEPTETEAQIGRIFERDGLAAACRWIDEKLMPIFERQESKLLKRVRPHMPTQP